MLVKDSVINVAITLPVNPPGTEQILTADDIWAGLLHSQRYSQEYVPHIIEVNITDRQIISDTTTSYKRVTRLNPEIYPDVNILQQDLVIVDNLKVAESKQV